MNLNIFFNSRSSESHLPWLMIFINTLMKAHTPSTITVMWFPLYVWNIWDLLNIRPWSPSHWCRAGMRDQMFRCPPTWLRVPHLVLTQVFPSLVELLLRVQLHADGWKTCVSQAPCGFKEQTCSLDLGSWQLILHSSIKHQQEHGRFFFLFAVSSEC